jgi:hypothetical protein
MSRGQAVPLLLLGGLGRGRIKGHAPMLTASRQRSPCSAGRQEIWADPFSRMGDAIHRPVAPSWSIVKSV